MSKTWHVVQTHPHSESKARFHLERQGFDVYLPRYWKSRRHARKTERVQTPLFPRYMFVALNLIEQHWWSINSTVGVKHMISDDVGPVAVPETVIAEIRDREGEDGTVCLSGPASPFRPGEQIQISEGPLSGLTAIFSHISGDQRVNLLLDLLGRSTKVRIPLRSVSALG